MTLTISVLPASAQAGRAAISALLKDERRPFVNAIYRDTAKAPAEFLENPRFKAVQGNVASDSGLDFSNSDAVFYIPPPTYDGPDTREFAITNANNIKAAVKNAPKVKRLLVFSGLGAQNEKGIGIIILNHLTDRILRHAAPEVVITKSGYFHEIWAEAFETMEADPPVIYSSMTPPDHKLTMIGVQDVGQICARFLLETGNALPASPHVVDLHGPRNYSTLEVQAALEEVAGRKAKLVSIEPDQLVSFYEQKVPQQYARELAEMIVASLPGGIIATEMEKTDGIIRGKLELVESLRMVACGETVKTASGVF